MPSLSDTAILRALKRVELSQKQEDLVDGEGRGTGRLVLAIKPMPKRVTADWMAQQHALATERLELSKNPSNALAGFMIGANNDPKRPHYCGL